MDLSGESNQYLLEIDSEKESIKVGHFHFFFKKLELRLDEQSQRLLDVEEKLALSSFLSLDWSDANALTEYFEPEISLQKSLTLQLSLEDRIDIEVQFIFIDYKDGVYSGIILDRTSDHICRVLSELQSKVRHELCLDYPFYSLINSLLETLGDFIKVGDFYLHVRPEPNSVTELYGTESSSMSDYLYSTLNDHDQQSSNFRIIEPKRDTPVPENKIHIIRHIFRDSDWLGACHTFLPKSALTNYLQEKLVGYFHDISIEIIEYNIHSLGKHKLESVFQSIYHKSPVGISMNALEGTFLHVNDKFCRNVGLSREELTGMSIDDFISSKDFKILKNGLDRANAYNDNFSFETKLRLQKKRSGWYEIYVAPLFDPAGHINMLIMAYSDISQRKYVEENLNFHSEVLNNMEESVIIVKSETLNIVYCNKTFEKACGFSEKEILDSDFSQFIHPKELNNLEGIWKHLTKSNTWKGELSTVGKGRNEVINRASFTHYNHPAFGKTFILIFDDITLLKSAEKSFHNMEKLNSIGLFAGGLAHDFNNILVGATANISLAQLQISKKSNPELNSFLDSSLSALQRAQKLTRQLLVFAKGGYPIKELANIAHIIHEVVSFSLTGSSIEVKYDIDDDLWAAKVDSGQIEQVFSNFALNAKEALGDAGNILIMIRNEKLTESTSKVSSGDYLRIDFSDTGVGIDKDVISNIFDPYFTTKEEGTGLGLSMTHSIILRHGGGVDVKSDLGMGTTFTIWLPADPNQKVTSISQVPPDSKNHLPPGIRILMVDDQDIIRNSVRNVLNANNVELVAFSNGAEAINYLKDEHEKEIHVGLLDLTIPGGIGGKEIVNIVKGIDSNIKLVAMSGYTEDPIMDDYSTYNFDAILPKPFTANELLQLIASIV